MPSRERVTELIRYVGEQRFVEALKEFYHEDAVLQENNAPPRVGLAATLAFEAAFLETVAEWRESRAESFVVDGDRVAIHWVFDRTSKTGERGSREEIAYQQWDGDHIIHERFFYDPAPSA
ncbi:polyketide cyclase [Capsulimonas corticalis]|uniref:Polyketide cyclase n=1 Tax=Capsulimonas corticalis TaxID=2219043 RepID=A0A402CTD6_9BACT|nr:nuclear transport factor 2 family protein [Capsulimonas corticalis]BDI30774.1 polyketide cyclase [Capsulimonas corticalis]